MFGKKKPALSIDDYSLILLSNKEANLPTMPPPEVQMRFTGKSQVDTMQQAVNFLKNVERGYQARTGRSLENSRILDFGCGWGRMLRLLPFFYESNLRMRSPTRCLGSVQDAPCAWRLAPL